MMLFDKFGLNCKKTNEKVIISILKTVKEQGSHDIEFFLRDPVASEWIDQVVGFEQLQQEVIKIRVWAG